MGMLLVQLLLLVLVSGTALFIARCGYTAGLVAKYGLEGAAERAQGKLRARALRRRRAAEISPAPAPHGRGNELCAPGGETEKS